MPQDSVVYGETCALCFDALARGDLNSTILSCGHQFHSAPTSEGCPGFFRWASEHDTCPTCRSNFDTGPNDNTGNIVATRTQLIILP